MDARRRVEFLLYFVQHSFAYATDEDQFGRENYLFPEEVLTHSASDCEDRAALFAWMVREFTNVEVIGARWDWHMATAVRLQSGNKDDIVRHGGKDYVLADPTYVGARLGVTLPQLRGIEPEVIELR